MTAAPRLLGAFVLSARSLLVRAPGASLLARRSVCYRPIRAGLAADAITAARQAAVAFFSSLLVLGILALAGCDAEPLPPAPPVTKPAAATKAIHAGEPRQTIVAFGDSLTAGYGLALDEAYPALLQDKLDAAGYPYGVVNAGVSGDTTAGGRRRLSWVLEGNDAAILIVALGGNDGLRGLAPSEMKANLTAIIEEAKAAGIRVLLAGIEAPPNHGADYTREFREVFPTLAEEQDVVLFPFLLEGVGGAAELNQPDGIHPNPEGAGIVSDNLWVYLEPMLRVLSREAAATSP